MKFTKESRNKISEAWNYNSAGTCSYAIAELNRYVDALLKSENVEIEDENIVLHNLGEFIIWKNKKWDLGQISILTEKKNTFIIELLNNLIINCRINKVKFIETDPNNRRFGINLISDEGQFSVYIGNVENYEILPCFTFNVESLKFDFIANKKYMLTFIPTEKYSPNINPVTTIYFNEIEIK